VVWVCVLPHANKGVSVRRSLGWLMHRAKRTNLGRIATRHPSRIDGLTGGDDYNAALEIRTTAGPSSAVQWVFIGGPYITRDGQSRLPDPTP
jgi:hypothetical protein